MPCTAAPLSGTATSCRASVVGSSSSPVLGAAQARFRSAIGSASSAAAFELELGSTCLFRSSLAFELGLRSAARLPSASAAGRLLLGLPPRRLPPRQNGVPARGSLALELCLGGAPPRPPPRGACSSASAARRASCRRRGPAPQRPSFSSAGGATCLLGLRGETGPLLGLHDVLSPGSGVPALSSLALTLCLRGAARLLLGLGRSPGFLLGGAACRSSASAAACLHSTTLRSRLRLELATLLFLGLARGGCGGELLAPQGLLRVDGVALGESLPLLRKLLNSLRRSPFPHHPPTMELSPRTRRVATPEVG